MNAQVAPAHATTQVPLGTLISPARTGCFVEVSPDRPHPTFVMPDLINFELRKSPCNHLLATIAFARPRFVPQTCLCKAGDDRLDGFGEELPRHIGRVL